MPEQGLQHCLQHVALRLGLHFVAQKKMAVAGQWVSRWYVASHIFLARVRKAGCRQVCHFRHANALRSEVQQEIGDVLFFAELPINLFHY